MFHADGGLLPLVANRVETIGLDKSRQARTRRPLGCCAKPMRITMTRERLMADYQGGSHYLSSSAGGYRRRHDRRHSVCGEEFRALPVGEHRSCEPTSMASRQMIGRPWPSWGGVDGGRVLIWACGVSARATRAKTPCDQHR